MLLARLRIRLIDLYIEYWLVDGAYVTFVHPDNFIQFLVSSFSCQNLILELLLSFNHFFQFQNFVLELLNILAFFLFWVYSG